MYFLDELDNMRLYRRSVLLPINEKDKKHTSLAFILSPNMEGTKKVFYNGMMIGKYYNSFYTERAVLYYINQEGEIEYLDNGEYIIEKANLFEPADMKI